VYLYRVSVPCICTVYLYRVSVPCIRTNAIFTMIFHISSRYLKQPSNYFYNMIHYLWLCYLLRLTCRDIKLQPNNGYTWMYCTVRIERFRMSGKNTANSRSYCNRTEFYCVTNRSSCALWLDAETHENNGKPFQSYEIHSKQPCSVNIKKINTYLFNIFF
jgi:hypothetical protein